MEDYNKVLDATEVAENANGVAAEKMTVYNESLAAAQNRLTASIQQFAQDSNLDQILAKAYDGLSKVVDILNILLNKIPILSPLIKALGVALATAFGANILKNVVNLASTITSLSTAASGALSILSATAFTIGSFAVPIWGVVAAVTAIGVALKAVYDIVQDNTPEAKLEKANQKLDESKKNIEDTQSQIADISKQIKEINDKGTLTLADKQEKQRLEEQRDVLEQILKYQTDINAENEKEVKKQTGEQMGGKYTSGTIDSDTAYERAKRKTSVGSTYAAASDDTAKLYNAENASVSELVANLRILDEERKELISTEGDHSKELTENNQKTQENIKALEARATAIGKDITEMQNLGLTDTDYYKNAVAQYNELQSYLDPSNFEKIQISNLIDTKGIEEKLQKAVQSGGEAGEKTAENYAGKFAQKILNSDKSIKKAWAQAMNIDVNALNIDNLTQEILARFQQMYGEINSTIFKLTSEQVADWTTQATNALISQDEAMKNYISTVANVTEKQEILNTAYSEMKEKGELSVATVQKLIEQEPSLTSALTVENGKIRINIDSLQDLSDSYFDTAITAKQQQIDQTQAVIDETEKRIKAMQEEMTALGKLIQKRIDAGEKVAATDLDQYRGYQKTQYYLKQQGKQAQETRDDLQEQLDALNKLKGAGLTYTPTTKSGSKSSKKSDAEKEFENQVKNIPKQLKTLVTLYSEEDAWNSQEVITSYKNQYKEMLEKVVNDPAARKILAESYNLDISNMPVEEQIDKLTTLIKKDAGTIEEAQQKLIKSSLDAQEKELKARQEIEKQEKEQYDQALEYIEDLEDATVSMIETGIDLLEKAGDIVFNLLGKISDRYDKQLDNLDKISDELDEQKDAFEEKIDAQKEMLKLQKEEKDNADELAEKNKSIADIDAQLMELQYDNSAEAQAKRLKLLDERAEKEKDLADWQNDYDYNTKIDALDKEKSEYEKTIEAEKKALEAQKETIENAQKSFETTLSNIQTGFNNFVKVLSSDVAKNLLAKALVSYGGDTAKNLLLGWNKIFGTGDDADITKLFDNLGKTGFQQGSWIGNFTNWLKSASNIKQGNIDLISGAQSQLSIEKNQLEAGNIDLTKVFTSGVDVTSIKNQLGQVTEAFNNTKTTISGITQGISSGIKSSFKNLSKSLGKFSSGLGSTVAPGIQSVSNLFGNLGDSIKGAFSVDWTGITGGVQAGLKTVSGVIGQLFSPIASGAASIGDAIGAGITGFFPGIFSALGTLVTTVGTAMSGVLDAIATAMASIPVAGWVIAAAAIAGAVALVASIAAITAKTRSAKVTQPTQSFTAKKHHNGADYVKKQNPALDKMLGLGDDETVSILKVGEAVVPTWANNATSSANSNSYTGSPFGSAVDTAVKSARASTQNTYNSSGSSVSISMPINIQGDADETTVRALKKEADSIVNNVLKVINKQTRLGGYRNIKAATI